MPRVESGISDKTLTFVIYGLYGVGLIMGFLPSLAAIIINYVKLKSLKESWIHDHFVWQINTFWLSLLFSLIAVALFVVALFIQRFEPGIAGVVLMIVTWCWNVYRLIKGCLYLDENKSVYPRPY